jgi:hypothetical protein
MKKIKALSSILISLFLILILVLSCTKGDSSEVEKNESARILSLDELSKKVKSGVEFECAGECNCYFDLNLDTGTGSCSCSPCHLDLTFIEDRVTITGTDKNDIYESILELEFFKNSSQDMPKYVDDNYQTKLLGYEGIEFYTKNNTVVVIFKFIGLDGTKGSVLYSQKIGGKKFRIDCTGSCDCLEQYNFNTNTASCSCSDCVMTVTEIL